MGNKHAWYGTTCLCVLLLSACIVPPKPHEPSAGHIGTRQLPAVVIPKPVRQTPFLPPPKPSAPVETYTVVVNEVPVKELLFALARDAAMNVDIHPGIVGMVTLNAVNQTLEQILNRIMRQVDIRYEIKDDSLVVSPDLPFLRTYEVDYVNLARDSTSSISVATQVSTTGVTDLTGAGRGGENGGDNNSTTTVSSTSNNRFWETLTQTIRAMVVGDSTARDLPVGVSGSVIPNPESGTIVVRATSRQHEQVQAYLDKVLVNARRQVLIEVTIVEVQLSDRYQAGIDWSKLASDAGLTVMQNVLGNFEGTPAFFLEYADSRDAQGIPNGDVEVTVQLLKEFGDARVLSTPKIMALNNQTAIFKVVENRVFFQVESDVVQTPNAPTVTTVTTTPQTVPVGLVMAVTPSIDGGDGVILNVRPTISRTIGVVRDPNPAIPENIPNLVPEIAARELESVLRLQNRQVAILGGLMQDDLTENTDGIPFLSDLPQVGELFKFRDNNFIKTELVVFLRATVVRNPSVETELNAFRPFLPENLPKAKPTPGPRWEGLP